MKSPGRSRRNFIKGISLGGGGA
ncbi:MAG TPA: hypothetical protein DIV39_02735, partial [Verrucomicrobiales bacterium]|nr:hypothetical protein [Verrucomicrobiales bacterium]